MDLKDGVLQRSLGHRLIHSLRMQEKRCRNGKRRKKHGFKEETEASITNKPARGYFSATWFLACLAALELDGVALKEI